MFLALTHQVRYVFGKFDFGNFETPVTPQGNVRSTPNLANMFLALTHQVRYVFGKFDFGNFETL